MQTDLYVTKKLLENFRVKKTDFLSLSVQETRVISLLSLLFDVIFYVFVFCNFIS